MNNNNNIYIQKAIDIRVEDVENNENYIVDYADKLEADVEKLIQKKKKWYIISAVCLLVSTFLTFFFNSPHFIVLGFASLLPIYAPFYQHEIVEKAEAVHFSIEEIEDKSELRDLFTNLNQEKHFNEIHFLNQLLQKDIVSNADIQAIKKIASI